MFSLARSRRKKYTQSSAKQQLLSSTNVSRWITQKQINGIRTFWNASLNQLNPLQQETINLSPEVIKEYSPFH